MQYKDYYAILGVGKAAGKDELKTRYRRLARRYHPDVNTMDADAGAKFGEISEAYDVLSDDEKRHTYDLFGSDMERYGDPGKQGDFDWSKYASAKGGKAAEGANDWDGFYGTDSGTSDFFRNIFGQGSQARKRSPRGRDLSAEVEISLEDAYLGGTREIGIGGRKIRIKLKPGIWDRQKIQIAGKGADGPGKTGSGDLFVTFLIKPHQEYRLQGADLYKDLPLSVFAAILGASVEVVAISGRFELVIPPETKNGTVFRLKGKGFPVYGKPGTSGDLFLRVAVQVPQNLTQREKDLVAELAAIRGEKAGGGKI